jgi:two-component system, NarL family, nitrate/nitrite response regulator NarL
VSIRALVVGDVRLYRDGLVLHLKRPAHISVVGTAADREQALARLRELRPDVVLLDMAMPESFDTVRAIVAQLPEVRVVALTVSDVVPDVIACAEAGVAGYVPREGTLTDLVAAIESVARGESLVSPRIAAALLRRMRAVAEDRGPESSRLQLTLRETEIVPLLAAGLSNKQIGARLCVEVATVKNHVHHILEKLQVHRRGEVAGRVRLTVPMTWSRLDASARHG